MNLLINNRTFGKGSNPHGGAYTEVFLLEEEIQKVFTAKTSGNGYYVDGVLFVPTRWDASCPRYYAAKVYHRLTVNYSVPMDGGENFKGMSFLEKLKCLFPWVEHTSEKRALGGVQQGE